MWPISQQSALSWNTRYLGICMLRVGQTLAVLCCGKWPVFKKKRRDARGGWAAGRLGGVAVAGSGEKWLANQTLSPNPGTPTCIPEGGRPGDTAELTGLTRLSAWHTMTDRSGNGKAGSRMLPGTSRSWSAALITRPLDLDPGRPPCALSLPPPPPRSITSKVLNKRPALKSPGLEHRCPQTTGHRPQAFQHPPWGYLTISRPLLGCLGSWLGLSLAIRRQH